MEKIHCFIYFGQSEKPVVLLDLPDLVLERKIVAAEVVLPEGYEVLYDEAYPRGVITNKRDYVCHLFADANYRVCLYDQEADEMVDCEVTNLEFWGY